MSELKKLEILNSYHHSHKLIENFIKNEASSDKVLQILDAGCGNFWPYNLKGIDYKLIGVDNDREAIAIRKKTSNDWHDIIEGDLCNIELENDKYDVIHCAFVLEHIKNADLVINNFVKWIKPGGIIIIRIPDPSSAQGFITKLTPHWFHVLYYKFILGLPNAGKPGFSPYYTFYSPIVSREGVKSFCNNSSGNVDIIAEYGDDYELDNKSLNNLIRKIAKKIINIISFGILSNRHSNLLYILRKKQ